jgi:hypothetical protein
VAWKSFQTIRHIINGEMRIWNELKVELSSVKMKSKQVGGTKTKSKKPFSVAKKGEILVDDVRIQNIYRNEPKGWSLMGVNGCRTMAKDQADAIENCSSCLFTMLKD